MGGAEALCNGATQCVLVCWGEGEGMLVCPVSRVAVAAFAALLLQAAVLAALPRDTLPNKNCTATC